MKFNIQTGREYKINTEKTSRSTPTRYTQPRQLDNAIEINYDNNQNNYGNNQNHKWWIEIIKIIMVIIKTTNCGYK